MKVSVPAILLSLLMFAADASAQTGFTFQGRVRDGGVLVDGTCDLTVHLYDVESGGAPLSTLIFAGLNTIVIDKGLFSVFLDFGDEFFDGSPRWLELVMECPPGSQAVTLTPRQPIDAAPYSIHALSGGEWTLDDDNVHYLAGNVGAGVAAPQASLESLRFRIVGNSAPPTSGTGVEMIFVPGVGGNIFAFDRDINQALPLLLQNTTDNLGDVGIGTDSPAAKLDVHGGPIRTTASNPEQYVEFDASGTPVVFNKSPAAGPTNFVIGNYTSSTSPPSFLSIVFQIGEVGNVTEVARMRYDGDFSVASDITAGGLCCGMSDARLKRDVEVLTGSLETVLALNPVTFNWRTEALPQGAPSAERQIGFIAQEVRALVPQAVVEDDGGMLALDYGRLTPVLVGAIQQLEAELEAERQRADELQDLVEAQELALSKVLAMIGSIERRLDTQD